MNSAAPLVASLALLMPLSCGIAADWPQWRGPQRNGISAERIGTNWPAEGPKLRWSAQVGTGFSGVSVADDHACTLGNTNGEDTVWCLNAKSGAVLWKHSYASQLSPQWYEGGPGATPTISQDRVFTISKWGDIFCFDLRNGSIVWKQDLRKEGIKPNRWGFAGSPLIWKNLVIFNAGTAGIAFDRETGREMWSSGTNATGYASPTLLRTANEDLVLIFAAQHLVAVNPQTGEERWRFPWKTDWDTNNSDPIVEEDHVFLSSFTHGCALLSVGISGLQPIYESKVVFNNLSPGVLLGGDYYVFSGEAKKDTRLCCIEFSTGRLKWSTKDTLFGSLLATRDHLLVLTEKGELWAYARPKSGETVGVVGVPAESPEPVAKAKLMNGTCWTPPSLANSLLYVRNARGEVQCLELPDL